MHLSFFANDFIRSFSTKRVSVVLGRLTNFTPFALFAEKLWTRQAFFRVLLEFLRVRDTTLRKLSLFARISLSQILFTGTGEGPSRLTKVRRSTRSYPFQGRAALRIASDSRSAQRCTAGAQISSLHPWSPN